MSIRFVGIDIHKRVGEVAILDEQGKVLDRTTIAMERGYLETFATRVLKPTDRVVVEATSNTWAVVQILKPHVAEVVVSNPMHTKLIAQAKVKTDKVDAYVLAQLLRCDYLCRVWEPDEATRLLRELTGRRSALVADRTAVRNRIHSLLAARLISPREGELFSALGLEWLKALILNDQGRMLLEADLRLHEGLECEIRLLDEELARRGYRDERVKLLMTLPGVNVAVAETLIAALGDIHRFPEADRAASYLGLVPKTHQSAARSYHGPITKAGNSQARWMLVQAAQAVRKHPGPLGHFFRKLAKKKNHNVAVVATARKLVVIAWHMLMTNEPYRYAQPRATEDKLAALRVRATGERRRGGAPKGKPVGRLPGGSRRIKPLSEVLQSEGLPALHPLRPGEQRAVQESGAAQFVATLACEQIVPRKASAPKRPARKNTKKSASAS